MIHIKNILNKLFYLFSFLCPKAERKESEKKRGLWNGIELPISFFSLGKMVLPFGFIFRSFLTFPFLFFTINSNQQPKNDITLRLNLILDIGTSSLIMLNVANVFDFVSLQFWKDTHFIEDNAVLEFSHCLLQTSEIYCKMFHLHNFKLP